MVRTKQRARRGCPRLFGGYNDLHSGRPTPQQSPTSTLSSGTLSSATAVGQLSSNLPGFQNYTTKAPDQKLEARDTPAASSTLSSVPSMFQTPDATIYSAKPRRPDSRTLNMRAFDETKYKADIKRVLHNDQQAAQSARRSAARDSKFDLMTPEQQERKMEEAAKDKLDDRKASDKHVSYKYPVFVDYITPFAYGKTGEGDSKKQLKDLIDTQIEALRQAYYASGGRAQRHDDGEDDHEEPPPAAKKEEGRIKREFSDMKEYTESHEAQTSQPRATVHHKEDSWDKNHEDSEEDDSEDEDSDKDDTIQVRHPGRHRRATTSAGTQKSNDGDDKEETRVPLVAVSRGMPLPEGAAMPVLASINLKQRFATGIRCVEQAVIRGQVPTDDGSTKSNSKKRASEHHERYGSILNARKRAKIEMEIRD